MKEPNISDMIRHIVSLKAADGATEFSFTELEMLIEAARSEYAKHGVTKTEGELDEDARTFRDQFNGLLERKMKSPFLNPTIKRHVAKAGFDCSVTLSRDEIDELVVSVTLSNEPIPKPPRNRHQAKAAEVVQVASDGALRIQIDAIKMQVKALAMWVPDFTKYDDEELSTARRLLEDFRKYVDALNGKSEEIAE